jgi:TM2 domain-containing membrane protein YozV
MMDIVKGAAIVRVNAIFTALFFVTAGLAALYFEQPWKAIAVGVALTCFSIGVCVFLWGYWSAVQRSREDNISVAAMYFLIDKCAPKSVARRMNGLLALQVLIGLVTAGMRTSTDGKNGSTLAFGILVPMLGLGLNGLWAAFYGQFAPRSVANSAGVSPQASPNGQDEDHD